MRQLWVRAPRSSSGLSFLSLTFPLMGPDGAEEEIVKYDDRQTEWNDFRMGRCEEMIISV